MPHILDLGSRKLWQLTGRRVDLEGGERWLATVSRLPRRVLRTDHELRLWSAPAVRLHYKCERAS